MNDFAFYFTEGWQHIISLDALDHQLFILALCAIWLPRDRRKLLVLVTAFTIGHSLTLALSATDVIRVNSALIEFLIPCTIVAAAVFNFLQKRPDRPNVRLQYAFALFFGLIHGLGFANTLRMMLSKDQSLVRNLLAFNLGLEAGQLLIVTIIMLFAFILVVKMNVPRNWWIWILSGAAFILAAKFAVERMVFLTT